MERTQEIEVRKNIYWFLWLIQRLIDDGKKADLEEIIKVCYDGKIFEYIGQNYTLKHIDGLINVDSSIINYLYENVGFSMGDVERKYDVHKNGLVYLSAIAIEWLYSGFEHLYK